MSTKRPWMPLYIDDFLAGTAHLTVAEIGAYILLIMHYWSKGRLPEDEAHIHRITRMSKNEWKKSRETIRNFFTETWAHERIDAELVKAIEKSKVNSANAAKSHENRRKIAPRSHVVSQHTLQTPERMVEEGDARAREAVSLSEIEDSLTGTQPVSMGVPIDHWQPAFVHPVDLDLLNQFCAIHEERGTFSKDWPTLWQAFLDEAKAPPPEPAKPKRRTAPPRVETNKRPEQPIGVRVLISEDAYALAKAVTAAMGVDGLPITVGMPAQMQTWMAAWPPDLILLTIQQVMARRPNDPPGSLKYFENAIARAFAESKRPLPVATVAPPSEVVTHVQRTEAKSISGAADRLIARIAAGGDGRPVDGSDESQAVAGPVPKIGRG